MQQFMRGEARRVFMASSFAVSAKQFCLALCGFTILAAGILFLCEKALGGTGGIAAPAERAMAGLVLEPLPAGLQQGQQLQAGNPGDFQYRIRALADQLFVYTSDPDPQAGFLADGIVVASFVDLKKLSRTSSLGRYIAEQMMTEFQQMGYPVMEARKSKAVRIQQKRGEYGLSRDPEEIGEEIRARVMLTGTYLATEGQIFVNARLIDNQNAELISSASMVFPRTLLTDELLADSASAKPRKNEIVYLKKLDIE